MDKGLAANSPMSDPSVSRADYVRDFSSTKVPPTFIDKLSMDFLALATKQSVEDLYFSGVPKSSQEGGDSGSKPPPNPTPNPNHSVPPQAPPTIPVDLLKQLVADAVTSLQGSSPDTYIPSPTLFGVATLSAADLKDLRDHRKDGRSTTSVESALSFLNAFLKTLPSPLLESEVIRALYIICPTESLMTLENLRFREANIAEIYTTLQGVHGTRRSRDELEMCIDVLLKNTQKEPINILLELEQLILSSPRATAEPDTLAKREAIRFLKALGGESFMNLIRANLPPLDKITFRDLILKLKCNFHDTLLELHRQRIRVREVSRNGPVNLNTQSNNFLPSPPVPPHTSNVVPSHPSGPSPLVPPRTFPPNQPFPGICFNCNKHGHTSKYCPASPPTPRFPPSLPYCYRPCLLHPHSNHVNIDCTAQQKEPCPLHRGGHHLGACRSQDPSFPPQNPNGHSLPSNSNTYSHTFSNGRRGGFPSHPRPYHPTNRTFGGGGVHSIQSMSRVQEAVAELLESVAHTA